MTFRWAESDAANDDARFADPGGIRDTEAPYRFTRTLARTRHNAELLAAHGAHHHLTGDGGDELFHHPSAYLHSLLRRRPVTAIKHIRGYRALRRWPWVATVSGLAHGGDLGVWWHQQAQQLTTGSLPRRTPDLGWGHPLRAPVWVTPAAIDTTRAVLHATGEQALPLAADRGQHCVVSILRMMGLHYRQLAQVFATAGLRLHLPYFDDRVIEAALAVRTHERTTPWRYKPLLVEAMRPILPEVIAARTTKGEFGEDVRIGLCRHLPEILEIFADSALATHGLINPDLLRRELLKPQVDWAVMSALEDLLGCETWLRAIQTRPSPRRTDAATAAP